jgi:hypothetical protein
MGVRLYYTSLRAVPEEIDQAVRAELDQYSREQPWLLCEPPMLYETEKDGKLRGGSKLNIHPWADEMEKAAASQPERNDIQELLRLLCDWSDRYGISWRLDIDGDRLGKIEGGVCRGDLLGKLEAIAGLSMFLGEEHPARHPGPTKRDRPEPPPSQGLRIWPGPD